MGRPNACFWCLWAFFWKNGLLVILMTFFCNFDWNFVIEFVHVFFFRSHRIFVVFQQLKVIDDVKNAFLEDIFFSDRKRHTNSEILFFITSFLLAVVLKCIPHMFPCWFIFFEVSKLSKFFLSIIPSGPEASIRLLFCKNFFTEIPCCS